MNLTYWVAGASVVWAVAGIFLGDISWASASPIILSAFAAFGAKVSQAPTNGVKGIW